jgi:thiopurine S-methyltransferase
MDHDFWHERWDQQQIGFHQPEGHPMLATHWPTLDIAPGTPVLVPLCGKTPDLRWLARQGYPVTGIELSERAAQDFFEEQQLVPTVDREGSFNRYSAAGIDIWVGDFFAADIATLGRFEAFYDRAALIALPQEMRADYVRHLSGLLAEDANGLLITLDYDQNEMKGPPFAVPESEVRQHFDDATVDLIDNDHGRAGQGMLHNRRVKNASEYVYRIAYR